MERLTFDGNFCDISQCRELPCPYDNNCTQKRVWERLKSYEDTRLSPGEVISMKMDMAIIKAMFHDADVERMKELTEADKAGRVVVLPCKVGDVVYGFHGDRTILPMVAKWIETNTDGWCVVAQYAPMAPKFYQFSEFGKTVFLTREEAERATEEMEGKKDG